MPIPVGPALIALFGLAFVGLAAVGIWDVHNIVKDYWYDNRFTLVKLVSINESIPFAGSVRICLDYPHVVFPELVFSIGANLSNATGDDFFGRNFGLYERRLPKRKNLAPSDNFSLTDRFDLFRFNDYIRRMDERGPEWINYTEAFLPITKSEVIEMVDTFLANPHSTQLIKDAWWNTREMFVHTPNPIETISMENVSTYRSCFDIQLGNILTRSLGKIGIALDLVHMNSSNETANIGPSAAKVGIYYGETFMNKLGPTDELFHGDGASFESGPKDQTTHIHMIVSNGQVIDRSNFPPCTTEFEDEARCLADLKQRTIGEVCQCTTFTRALKHAFRNENHPSPLCTASTYEKCWTRANRMAEARLEAARADQSCTPCVIAKNFYKINKADSKPFNTGWHPWYPRTVLTIECNQGSYLLYHEREQNSVNQLLSMIGGDLGLYIGFSMISLLQMCLFVYHMHKHHKECDQGDVSTSNYKRWFRHCVCYVFRSFQMSYATCESENTEAKYHKLCDQLEKNKNGMMEMERQIKTLNEVLAANVGKQIEMVLDKKLEEIEMGRRIKTLSQDVMYNRF